MKNFITVSSAQTRIALAICAYFVVLACIYALTTPFFEPPDENAHFLYIHNLLETGQLQELADRETVMDSQAWQRHHPPLYYAVGALLVSWTARDDVEQYLQFNPLRAPGSELPLNRNKYLHNLSYPSDTDTALTILRFYSIALSVGTLWLTYRTGALAFGEKTGLLAMFLLASLPGFVFISASINNDNLITLMYAAGIYLSVRMWNRREITNVDIIAACLILSGAVLSKATGLSLFVAMYGALIVGVLRGRYPLWCARLVVMYSLGTAIVLTGWWFLRNLQLYGDPLAIDATRRIWGNSPQWSDFSSFLGVMRFYWDSFWLGFGTISGRGAAWFTLYHDVITALAVVGCGLALNPFSRLQGRGGSPLAREKSPSPVGEGFGVRLNPDYLLFFAAICALIIASLISGTAQMLTLYEGRIAFPMLAAFMPLLAVGLQQIFVGVNSRVRPIVSALLIAPLSIVALAGTWIYIQPAFPALEAVTTSTGEVEEIYARVETLSVVGYRLETPVIYDGGMMRAELYIYGRHDENLVLSVKALHPITLEPLGGVDVYPGMAQTSSLERGTVYRVPVAFPLNAVLEQPYQLVLSIGWYVPESDGVGVARIIPLTLDADSVRVRYDALLVAGPTYVNTPFTTYTPHVTTNIDFGDVIRLVGYDLDTSTLTPGGTLTPTLYWQRLAAMSEDWTLALGLLDANDQVVTQADGMPAGYPTSAWIPEVIFADTREITIPSSTPPGDYRLYLGWYRLEDGQRLTINGTSETLYFVPVTVAP